MNKLTDVTGVKTAVRCDAGGDKSENDRILAREERVCLRINDNYVCEMTCSPCRIEELCVGRAVSEGIIKSTDEIAGCKQVRSGGTLLVNMRVAGRGSTDKRSDDRRSDDIRCDEDVFNMLKEAANCREMHDMTEGTHSCVLFCNNELIESFEDIGRHNALDKAIGYAYINKMNVAECALVFTGRVMTETVKKLINSGIRCLVTKSNPTYEAAETAKENNIVLICRAWPDSYEVY